MYISKVKIKNFRGFESFDVDLSQVSVIVGENETGKSNFFSALSLPLSRSDINFSQKNLSVADININAIKSFFSSIISNESDSEIALKIPRVSVEIEITSPENDYQEAILHKCLKPEGDGTTYGIKYLFNPKSDSDFISAVKELLRGQSIETVNWFTLPVEFYEYNIISTNNGKQIAFNDLKPLIANIINAERDDFSNASNMRTNSILTKMLTTKLSDTEKSKITAAYNSFFKAIEDTETFKKIIQFDPGFENFEEYVKNVECIPNLPDLRNILSNITLQAGEVFLYQRGLGQRNIIYLILLFEFYKLDKEYFNLCCIEEPESHLGVNNLRLITDYIYKSSKSDDSKLLQTLISSHNPSVINKLDLSNVIVFSGEKAVSLKSCPADLQNYVRKRPNFDVLKLLFAQKIILVEGPTEEMLINSFVQKDLNNINDIEVLVTGKGFTTFLDLWLCFNKDNSKKKIGIIRDFDNQPNAKDKHDQYDQNNKNICVRTTSGYTLEDDFSSVTGNLPHLISLLGLAEASTSQEVATHMKNAKTEEMLKVCDGIANLDITLPAHIQEVIDFMA